MKTLARARNLNLPATTATLLFRFLLLGFAEETTAEFPKSTKNLQYNFKISVPDIAGYEIKVDKYVCTVLQLNFTEKEVFLEKFHYTFSDTGNAHHFLLYGCKSVSRHALEKAYWPCNSMGNVCSNRKHIPLGIPQDYSENYKGKAPYAFPDNVAYGVGAKFDVNFIMLEVHYAAKWEKKIVGESKDNNETKNDNAGNVSGIIVQGTTRRPKYLAGMMVLAAAGFQVPPGLEKFSVNINCQPRLSQKITPYAYWVHTHDLGQVVSGYKVEKISKKFTELARWTWKWKQPVVLNQVASDSLSIFPGDYIAGKCTFNSSSRTWLTKWGPRKAFDEMCNLFLFYFTSSFNPQDLSISCVNENSKKISQLFPTEADRLPDLSRKKLPTNTTDLKQNNIICNLYKAFGILQCPFQFL